jgi:putative ABC transport system permease protein
MTKPSRIGRLRPARLSPRDVVRVGSSGLRTRPLRVVLSALGIAIGIAAMVAVLGISTSSKAEVNAELDRLGTNLLVVSAGQSLFGEDSTLPEESVDMIAGLPEVERVSAVGSVDANVYRTDKIPSEKSGGIAVKAARTDLLGTVGGTVRSGAWLNAATSKYPAVVLGSTTARRLGITAAGADVRVWLGDQWFTVVGILDPVSLVPALDTSALVGWSVAEERLGFDGRPTSVYERSADDAVDRVRSLLPATANPEHPDEVEVTRPSDALAARAAVNETLTGLLLGLGAVALLVGGVGVANTMVISVLERRSEIGLRRSLGATRGQIRGQFLTESILLSGLGAVSGVILGAAVTYIYARSQDWLVSIPATALGGAAAATLLIGSMAGLYPAVRAARMDPTAALATT